MSSVVCQGSHHVPPGSVRSSLRRRLAGWAGIEDRPPAAQESWWFPDDSASSSNDNFSSSICVRGRHHQHQHQHQAFQGGRSSSADTCSTTSQGRYDSDSTQGDAADAQSAPAGTKRRSRKRDWFKVLLAARNLATFVYALSNTTTLPMLPFMANRLIFPRTSEGPGDPGSDGVPEAWRGMAYGLVMSGYYLTKMISAPWIGFLSDKVGRRQALVVTLLGGALTFIVTKLWGQHSIHGLIICRLLMGCFAANGALMHAYIRDTVPQEWQSSAFSQHSASWGCAYLAAPAVIAWAGDVADRVLSLATIAMIISAAIVEITFVDTRPEGHRTQRMSSVFGEIIIEGARDLAEVGKKVSGLDLADYFNGGKEKEGPAPPPVPQTTPPGRQGKQATVDGAGGGEGLRRREVNGNGYPNAVRSNGGPHFSGSGTTNGMGRDTQEALGTEMPSQVSGSEEKGGNGRAKKRLPARTMSSRALVGVFRGMMKERLVLVTFVLQAIRPAQDLAPLVAQKFAGGASVLAGINSSRSLCRALVPMTPLIPSLVRLAGGASGEGAAARMRGDRAIAALMCLFMAGLVAYVPRVGTLQDLHRVMFLNGLCYIVRDSTAGAVMARAAGTASVGAFFGWQHCIKGIQGTFSTFLTGWLSGYSIAVPYYAVAVCDLVYAFTYLYI